MASKVHKACDTCGDMFEPLGLEGIKNAYCGTCEKDLEDGFEGVDEHGVPHYWRKEAGEWKAMAVRCDICGDLTEDDERITSENWEFCEGLQKQFCGACRERRQEPPCEIETCEADVCYDLRHERWAAEGAYVPTTPVEVEEGETIIQLLGAAEERPSRITEAEPR